MSDGKTTTAELDELQKRLREMRGPNVWEAADALAALRRDQDDLREENKALHADCDYVREQAMNIAAANARKDAALRAGADYLDAVERNMLANDVDVLLDDCQPPSLIAEHLREALTPASGKRTKRYATPDGKAPASPAAGLDDAIEDAARFVLENSRRGDASLSDEQFAADTAKLLGAYRDIIGKAVASGFLAPASPSPGLTQTAYGLAKCKYPDTCEAPQCYCAPNAGIGIDTSAPASPTAACPKCGLDIAGAVCKRIDCARLAPASPSPGLRESDPFHAWIDGDETAGLRAAVIEECAMVAYELVKLGASADTMARRLRALAQEGGK